MAVADAVKVLETPLLTEPANKHIRDGMALLYPLLLRLAPKDAAVVLEAIAMLWKAVAALEGEKV